MKIEPAEASSSSWAGCTADNEPTSTAATSTQPAELPGYLPEQLTAVRHHGPKRNSKRGTTKIIKKECETAGGGGDGDKDEELLGGAAAGGGGGENIKRRRTWELWSSSDKHMFFDALNEFGKDFDLIQQHFQTKLKTSRGSSNSSKTPLPAHYIKNKNQIRHFYYRTWHKIAPHIQFGPNIKKSTRELYGLVNYGELWKKVGGTLGGKLGPKLHELVQKGSTAIKHKGKTLRIRTPVCRALKELHSKAGGWGGTDATAGGVVRGPVPAKLPSKVCLFPVATGT
jgi:hypothetical protein